MTRLLPWILLILLPVAGRANAVSVVVTVKPLHSIVASVMQDVGAPLLLLDGTVSPHTDRIKPSTLRHIRSADLFIWIGPGLESFLAPAVADLPASVKLLTASESPLPVLLEVRDGQGHQQNENTHVTDPHLWLDPVNAAALAVLVADQLSAIDRDNAPAYRRNANLFSKEMSTLEVIGLELLAADVDKPFILFHDFIQYFENRFSLSSAGVVSYQPQITASARHLRELNKTLVQRGVRCILTEPQFEDRALRSLDSTASISYTVVDPLASGYDTGASLYAEWFKDMVGAVHSCLGSSQSE